MEHAPAPPKLPPVRPENPTPEQEAEYLQRKAKWDELLGLRDEALQKAANAGMPDPDIEEGVNEDFEE